jgi:predicted flavoprotein YhiN
MAKNCDLVVIGKRTAALVAGAPCHFVGRRVAVIDHLPQVVALIQELTQK